jgi:gas vesicle protein
VAIAFSGAQELHSFFLDPTTALRMRSAEVNLENLGESAVAEMASALGVKGQKEVLADVLEITGGHAGLSWLLLKRLASTAVHQSGLVRGAIAEFCSDKQHVMRRWHDGLSPEAKSLATLLARGAPLSRSSAASALRAAGYDPALNIRAFNELVFTGMAVRDGASLRKVGRIFWDFLTTVQAGVPTGASRAPAPGSRFVFKRVGHSWWFRFDGEDYGSAHKELDGFRYIACLLGRKTTPTHCAELKLKCKQPPDDTARDQLEQLLNDVEQGYGPKQKYASKRTKTDWHEAIEQVDELIAEAREAGDPEKAERLEDQKERLEKERSKQIGLGGRLRAETAQEMLEDRTRKAVGKAMKEAIAYLKTNCPKLGEHLEHDTQGIECFSSWPQYRGRHDWDTEEVATR